MHIFPINHNINPQKLETEMIPNENNMSGYNNTEK